MRLPSRIASAMLAVSLAVSAFCMPASAAKYSTLTFPDAAGNQITYLDQQYQDIADRHADHFNRYARLQCCLQR